MQLDQGHREFLTALELEFTARPWHAEGWACFNGVGGASPGPLSCLGSWLI
jgi:hypothetical protein